MAKHLTRSEIMSRIRGRDTKPELMLRRALWASGCRYRIGYDLPGRPDVAFVKARLAVFTDGCFWHGCPYHYSAPNTHQEFWESKLRRNVLRDLATDDALASEGWRVLRIWQHELAKLDDVVLRIRGFLNNIGGPEEQTSELVAGEPQTIYEEPRVLLAALTSDSVPRQRFCENCGTEDIRVLSLSGPGSLRPQALKRPQFVEFICRRCRHIWNAGPRDKTCNDKV
jgi:DNA mismatch endonuclease (patch repair protein)